MSAIPAEYRYSSEHEWVSPAVDGVVTVGITDHAQSELGDVVYVDLPEVGATVAAGDSIAVVESVKAASDVYSPVSGEVVEVNEELDAEPGTVNTDANGAGWLCKIRLTDPSEVDGLMDAAAYADFCQA